LDLWLKREKETGDYAAIANKQGRHSKIKDEEKFKLFVKENQDKTQTKMAEVWGNNISQQNISYTCQKLGITRKKNLRVSGKSCCNRHLFEAWLSESLIPQLEPGDIIIVDNATFHKGESIREIVENAGCEIWYLPAYSPDLNKIENWWSVLKTWMKQMLPEFETVRECVDAAFKNCPNVFA
jgi:transposase